MQKSRRRPVVDELQALFSVGTHAGVSDGELLARFNTREGEAAELAFAALVERHGPMVFRVCRRLLVDPHTTEDAFQATFLVLAQKARTLRDRGSVANWLYGVAGRVAARARTLAARRERHERRYGEALATRHAADGPDRHDREALLHEEVGRLPERYRTPVVLCYLEGLTQEQAAARLGWPIGTVRSRLARARDRLRGRLIQRGVGVSVAMLVPALAAEGAAVPRRLLESTVKAAMNVAALRATATGAVPAAVDALTQGVLRSMLMTKLKIVAAVFIATATAAAGAGVYATQDEPKDRPGPNTAPPPTTASQAGGRSARIGEYLERTKQEVEASINDLEAEVDDLRARLAQAEANLRRMRSVKAALTDQPEHRAKSGGFPAMQGMMMSGYPNPQQGQPGNSQRAQPQGQPNDSQQGQANRAQAVPKAGNPQGAGLPKGVDRRTSSSAEDSSEERRRALDRRIEELTRERDQLSQGSKR